MQARKRKTAAGERGFTLIELMVVVGIIGVLSSVAIPSYIRYQLKAKSAEAGMNLGEIRAAEEVYKAEEDVYMAAAAAPGGALGSAKRPWVNNVGFDTIGFTPKGAVYYNYSVDTSPASRPTLVDGSGFPSATGVSTAPELGYVATAEGDLDGDGITQIFGVTDGGAYVARSKAGTIF